MTMLRRAEKVGRKYLNPVSTTVGGPGMVFKVLPRMIFNRAERVPRRPLGPFRTDPAVYTTPPATGLRVTWFGHSSTLVEIDGVRILIDPVWDQRASPWQWFGPKRFFAPTLRLEDLPQLDAVLISHDHFDHLGEGTARQLAKLQPAAQWVTSLGVGAILQKFGVPAQQIEELDWMETITVSGTAGARCVITSLPSRHFSGRSLANRFETLWASFCLRGMGAHAHSIYFGADSGWWEGFQQIGEAYGPFDLTLLEIGAFDEMWHQIHMGPDGAAQVFRELGNSGLLMPIHWGLFDLALHGWREPIERMLKLATSRGIRLWSPQPGLPAEVARGAELLQDWWRPKPLR